MLVVSVVQLDVLSVARNAAASSGSDGTFSVNHFFAVAIDETAMLLRIGSSVGRSSSVVRRWSPVKFEYLGSGGRG